MKATGYIRVERQIRQVDGGKKKKKKDFFVTFSMALQTFAACQCVFRQGRVFTCMLSERVEPRTLSAPPYASSCWWVYVTPMEPTAAPSDFNTNCKLVFSLALAMTFTSSPPWQLAVISSLCYFSSLVCTRVP